jgi:hypothetical protein
MSVPPARLQLRALAWSLLALGCGLIVGFWIGLLQLPDRTREGSAR